MIAIWNHLLILICRLIRDRNAIAYQHCKIIEIRLSSGVDKNKSPLPAATTDFTFPHVRRYACVSSSSRRHRGLYFQSLANYRYTFRDYKTVFGLHLILGFPFERTFHALGTDTGETRCLLLSKFCSGEQTSTLIGTLRTDWQNRTDGPEGLVGTDDLSTKVGSGSQIYSSFQSFPI